MVQKKDSVKTMVVVLTVTCMVAGICLSFTYNQTKDAIAQAELDAQLRSVRTVLPPFDGEPEVITRVINGKEKTLYIGRKNGVIVGVAISSTSLGYGGTLKILVGIRPDGTITGIELLQHKETPGLGAKASSSDFLTQFKGKFLTQSTDEIKVKKDGGDIDSITAATITSRAVAKAATTALREFMQHKDEILR